MDKIVDFPLDMIPTQSLNLRLARSPIKMRHTPRWKVDKINPVHDLIVCLSGRAEYQVGPDTIAMTEGDMLLIPAYTRFKGRHVGGSENYTGVAQHFSLELFNRGDVIQSMDLRRTIKLSDWDSLKPLITLYREKSFAMTTTLQQHHQFMVILLAFLRDAFVGWQDAPDDDPQDQLSMQIMLVASRLSTDPLGNIAEEVLASVPYNADYFRRAFRNHIGMTPQKYRESKRMEFALHRLQMGATVKQVAAELGYRDPYFFSRQFKRHVGASPSRYRARRNKTDDL